MSDDVQDYLARLEGAAAELPADRRQELMEEISAHIAAAGATDEAQVRVLLDRLGPPEDIVAAAREDLPAPAPLTAPRGTGHEVAAVLMLTAGSLVPVVGWLAGVALLWTSTLWRTRDKVLGTLVLPGGPGAVLALGGLLPLPAGGLGAPLAVLLVVAPLVVAGVLLQRARRRAAEQRVPVQGGAPAGSGWDARDVAVLVLLGVGAVVVPVLPLVAGAVLMWTSRRWPSPVKAAATAVLVLPVLGLPAYYLTEGRVGLLPGNEGLFAVWAFGPVLGLAAAVLLLLTARPRAAAA